jgi:hypothetical protein
MTRGTDAELWALTHAARRSLVDDLSTLTEEQWGRPTLCADWDVERVVAHLTAAATLGGWRWIRSIVGAGFRPAVHNERRLREQLGGTPSATLTSHRCTQLGTCGRWLSRHECGSVREKLRRNPLRCGGFDTPGDHGNTPRAVEPGDPAQTTGPFTMPRTTPGTTPAPCPPEQHHAPCTTKRSSTARGRSANCLESLPLAPGRPRRARVGARLGFDAETIRQALPRSWRPPDEALGTRLNPPSASLGLPSRPPREPQPAAARTCQGR